MSVPAVSATPDGLTDPLRVYGFHDPSNAWIDGYVETAAFPALAWECSRIEVALPRVMSREVLAEYLKPTAGN